MKKIWKKEKGFSLAEALITLLIVCLITLATIPVLTKKKRDLTSSGHGVWMCTRNSADEYVYYSKEADNGDPNNPNTWTKTGTDSCEFKPPAQARNFSITLIGGGGGGGNGVSKYQKFLEKTSGSSDWTLAHYTEETLESGFYEISVVGGGGGSGGANNNSDYGPGAGGSSSFAKVNAYLTRGNVYSYSVGKGGDGGDPRWNGGWKDPDAAYWAGDGTGSSFNGKNGDVKIVTYGGGGGLGRGCGRNFLMKIVCGGGAGGSGGKSPTVSLSNGKIDASYAGISGATRRWDGGGAKLSLPAVVPAGSGDGAHTPPKGGSPSGYNGSSGAIIVSQLRRWHAKGGNAGELRNMFLSSIKGKAEITIPPAAESTKKGGMVELKIVGDKLNKNFMLTANGGNPGEVDKTLTDPLPGENSLWSGTDGGEIGPECVEGATKDRNEDVTVTYEDFKCVKKTCSTPDEITYTDFGGINRTVVRTIPAFLEFAENSAYVLEKDALGRSLPTLGEFLLLSNYIKDAREFVSSSLPPLDTTSCYVLEDNESVTKEFNINRTSFYRCYIFRDSGCFGDNRGLVYNGDGCEKEEKVTVTETKNVFIPGRPPHCDPAGNGKKFGAGGGGGRANPSEPKLQSNGELLGLSGDGGKGAPGAVIIEW